MVRKLYEFIEPGSGLIELVESKDGKDLFMQGLFIQGDVKNQNGRLYPKNEIKRAVSIIREKLDNGESVMGELDHPEELQINLDRVSHIILEMGLDKCDGFGKLKLLDTPMGNIAKSLLRGGAKLGVSSRGSGNVNESGQVSEFEIITVDIVAQPSAPDAYPKTIYESLYNMRGGETLYGTAAAASHDIRAEKHLEKAIYRFIKEINQQ